MEGFDTMSMPYLASPLSLSNLQGSDYLHSMPGMDMPDQRSTFESEPFVSGDDIAFSQHGVPPTSLKRFPSDYQDPFTDMVPAFDPAPPEQPSDSSIDHNNKLLSFSLPAYSFTLLDYSLRRTSVSLAAQLHGMFFLAESPWTTSPTENAPPQQGAELTCYRRNLFQITGSVTLPRSLRYIMTEQGDRIPILAQELTVSATESVEGNSVKIISVPWKTPAANQNQSTDESSVTANGMSANPSTANPKVEKEPPPIPLDIMAGQDLDTDYATFPIAWKRLQFRVATANNGRRKELQQHFVVRLKVIATLSTGARIPICEVHSGPVIVRGRSPRNFQSRKDLPLSGSAAASRKNTQSTGVNRTPTSDSAPSSNLTPAKAKTTVKSSSPETAVSQGSIAPPPPATADWTQISPAVGGTITSAPLPHSSVYAQSSPDFPRPTDTQRLHNSIPAPINLSLFDEDESGESINIHESARSAASYSNEVSHGTSNIDGTAPPAKMRKLSHGLPRAPSRSASSSLPLLGSTNMQQSFASTLPFPNESADLLYEYFPLGLDDWQAPVDAVYRPHVVHHTNLPEVKFVAARGRSKRYFAAEDVF
ncbi:PhoG like DNA-binding family protein [Aspergillus japonicus CBS 114.51]|uniref:PhoG like DNA-binding family protein n=1 Tax=Aspergillus japonicus CBS 114.51 TaxID=1448312 RepID=A0A8T8XC95_ASPJA|nr:PhoG like DNA-binding family protein [Aspergillus japonicus CBS 114.51]RAH85876.1 PhoG like DNA-binding family protein [Aspergillus japonicus CBS 114.51]